MGSTRVGSRVFAMLAAAASLGNRCGSQRALPAASLDVSWDTAVCGRAPLLGTNANGQFMLLTVTRGDRAPEVVSVNCAGGGRHFDFLDATDEPWTVVGDLLDADGRLLDSANWVTLDPFQGLGSPPAVTVQLFFFGTHLSHAILRWRINGQDPAVPCAQLGLGSTAAQFAISTPSGDLAPLLADCSKGSARVLLEQFDRPFDPPPPPLRSYSITSLLVGQIGVPPDPLVLDRQDFQFNLRAGEAADLYVDFAVTALRVDWTLAGQPPTPSRCSDAGISELAIAAKLPAGSAVAKAFCADGFVVLGPGLLGGPGTFPLDVILQPDDPAPFDAGPLPQVTISRGEIARVAFDLQQKVALAGGGLEVHWTLADPCADLGATGIHFVLDDAAATSADVACAAAGSFSFQNLPPRTYALRAWLVDPAGAQLGLQATASVLVPPGGRATAQVALVAQKLPVIRAVWSTSPACDTDHGSSVLVDVAGAASAPHSASAACGDGQLSFRVLPGSYSVSATLQDASGAAVLGSSTGSVAVNRGDAVDVQLAFAALVSQTVAWTIGGALPTATNCADELGGAATVQLHLAGHSASAACVAGSATFTLLPPGTAALSAGLLDSNGDALDQVTASLTLSQGAPAASVDFHPVTTGTLQASWTVDGSAGNCPAGASVSFRFGAALPGPTVSCAQGQAAIPFTAGTYEVVATLRPPSVTANAIVQIRPRQTAHVSFAFSTPAVGDVAVSWTVNGGAASSNCGSAGLGVVRASIGGVTSSATCTDGAMTLRGVPVGTADLTLTATSASSGATVAQVTRASVMVTRNQLTTVSPPIDLQVTPGPVASFTIAWNGNRLVVDASASTGGIATYEWWESWVGNPADPPDHTGSTPTFSWFGDPGTTVRLRVTDRSGRQDSITHPAPPRPP